MIVIELDDKRKHAQFTLDQNLGEAKKVASEIGRMMKDGRHEEANSAKGKEHLSLRSIIKSLIKNSSKLKLT